jgi:hypothetical protein
VQTKNDERDASLARIAAAAEAKNLLLQQQLMFQMFMQSPNTIASKAYFEQMSCKYIQEMASANLKAAATCPANIIGNQDSSPEVLALDQQEDAPIIVIVVYNQDQQEDTSTNIEDHHDLHDNNYSDNNDEDSMFEPLPPTQMLVSAFVAAQPTGTNTEVADDTQMTTLSF